jgi:predicted permease
MKSLRALPSVDSFAQDVRFGARLLWRTPLTTAVAVVSLALGLSATAAVFNMADAVLLRQLAVRAPHELHEFSAAVTLGAATKNVKTVSAEQVRELQQNASFGELGGFQVIDDGVLAGTDGEPQILRVELVSENYFDMLGVAPSTGRLLASAETGPPVSAVISERLWRSRFAGDPAIAGRQAIVNGVPVAIVGVARSFRGLLAERPADIFVPAAAGGLLDAAVAASGLRVVARLRPNVSVAAAEGQMAVMYRDVALRNSLLRSGEIRVRLLAAGTGASDAREAIEFPVVLGLALAGVLLLVACANTGGLLAARATARAGEFGIRIAVGAGRLRLIRQLFIEALLIAALAAAAALAVAAFAAPALLSAIPLGSGATDFESRFDLRLVAFTAALGLAAALVAGAAPIIRFMGSTRSVFLPQSRSSAVSSRRRVTNALIAAQVACSMLLLTAAAGMTGTLINLHNVDPGFDPTGIAAITVDATGRSANGGPAPSYYTALHRTLSALPQTAAVSFAQVGLMTSAATTGTVEFAGWSPSKDEDRWTRLFWVGPDFFDTLRIPVLAGGTIGAREVAGRERIAVVNRAFAEFYFGSVPAALGRIVNRDIRIVGVAADARYGNLREAPVRAMFVPFTQAPPRSRMTFIVRSRDRNPDLARAIMAAVRSHDPALKPRITPLSDQVAATFSRERFVAGLATGLSALALLLSCAGLYAAVAYAVSQRRHELAVRLALGASGRDVVRLLLSSPLRVTIFGVIAGIPAAYALMRAVASLLFDVRPFDVRIVTGCGLALLAVAAAAALWPARRALAIDPKQSLECT